jgi:hypothetical protein
LEEADPKVEEIKCRRDPVEPAAEAVPERRKTTGGGGGREKTRVGELLDRAAHPDPAPF